MPALFAIGALVFGGQGLGGPFVALAIATLLVHDARPQRRAKRRRVVCKPGVLAIPGTKIRAHDLIGATTARHEDGISLMLSHVRRPTRPIILDVRDEAALGKLCRALGIGFHGFGWVDVATTPPAMTGLRSFSAIMTLVLALGLLVPSFDLAMLFGMAVACSGLLWAITASSTTSSKGAFMRLTDGGIYVAAGVLGSRFVGFDKMTGVHADKTGIVVTTLDEDGKRGFERVEVRTSRFDRHAPSRSEIDHVVSQLAAAIDRAHGRAALEPAREAFTVSLERAPGEALRDWLARIDAMSLGGAGYRSSAVASKKELWELLEDPDAKPNVRAAAARLLSRSAPDELRVRIGDVLATIRDEPTRVRIAATVDDDALAEAERSEALERRDRIA